MANSDRSSNMPTIPNDEESQPLVPRGMTRRRDNSVASFLARGRSNTISSLKSGYETVKKHKDEFWLLIIGSIVLYLGFTLAFLPRTSLSRDFRRWHFSKLTKPEAFRIYVEAIMKENKCPEHLSNYTSRTHWAGDVETLEYTVEEMTKLGFTPKLEKYHTWLNEPVRTEVTLWELDHMTFNASMIEDYVVGGASADSSEQVFGFHGYSANGTVKSEYVYCNYGNSDDYKYLIDNNIELKGKVHIIRSGTTSKGIAVRNAEERGALGAILYTDSSDDGLITERNGYKAYPDGPARHESSIERGSVLLSSNSPGDPSTPGAPSKLKQVQRLNATDVIPSIPSVPMSEREVAPLLRHLNGNGIQWTNKGNVKGFQYFSGPSDMGIECQIVNDQKYILKEITNVIVEIPGIFKEQDIIIGNHRDAWTSGGAGAPNSGSAILLEIARGFSLLHQSGWKPLRTIKLISWDGGEQGMLGSTEYGEEHSKALSEGTVAYLNLDVGVVGSILNVKSNPLLNELIIRSSKRTLFKDDPDVTLYDYWKETSGATLGLLGSGTDFAVFQNHLGIPSVDFSFTRDPEKDAVAQFHSNYDSYEWMEKFGDPDFSLHSTMAMFVGVTTLSLAENELLGFKTNEYMVEISEYYNSLYPSISKTFPKDKLIRTLQKNLADALELLTTHSSLDFDSMVDFVRDETQQDYPWWQWNKKLLVLTKLISTNSKLRKLDRYFLSEEGLKGRSFMKHSIFAPDKITGNQGDVLPGLHEAVLSENRQECIFWLETLLTQLDKIVSLLTT
ncbi:unnamed protein product [Kluyveromyces dobzhanskii CBS 2104]|uniref:WGS project CCBQ000000000 data, contig 00016 n=1 Tax=Kluyveromyces dobzhanskii CBS 2104 TaxID=1427455 RepID=A0A0A8KZR3_9SACH|nr:unnamed protein product [Kluyveromyces dobzhanskii CBS 2104]